MVEYGKLDLHTNESYYYMVDELEKYQRTHVVDPEDRRGFSKQFEEREKLFGINYEQSGVLFDKELRSVVEPADGYFRDWQHTLCSSGVAGTEVAGCLSYITKSKTLEARGITLETIEEYCGKFKLASSLGRINDNWFKSKFLAKDHVKHFASDVLAMVPLLASFLETMVAPLGLMPDHTKCMGLLRDLLHVLQYNYVMTDTLYRKFRKLVDDHHRIFVTLYHSIIKIKFHHLLHLPEDLLRLQKILSCFVTERKHRDWKSISLYCFRSVESASTMEFVNYAVQEFVSGRLKFVETYLLEPETHRLWDTCFETSVAACLRAGEVRRRDVIIAQTINATVVGEVLRFFSFSETIFVQMLCFEPLGNNDFGLNNARSLFISGSSVRAKCAWAHRRSEVIHVLVPSILVD